jgi:uncharacterized protein (DUF1800 family)
LTSPTSAAAADPEVEGAQGDWLRDKEEEDILAVCDAMMDPHGVPEWNVSVRAEVEAKEAEEKATADAAQANTEAEEKAVADAASAADAKAMAEAAVTPAKVYTDAEAAVREGKAVKDDETTEPVRKQLYGGMKKPTFLLSYFL